MSMKPSEQLIRVELMIVDDDFTLFCASVRGLFANLLANLSIKFCQITEAKNHFSSFYWLVVTFSPRHGFPLHLKLFYDSRNNKILLAGISRLSTFFSLFHDELLD